MSLGLLCRLLGCVFILALAFYASIEKQNEITQLEICLPKLVAEVEELCEANGNLRFEIEKLEHPKRLFALLKKREFSHLVYPRASEVVHVKEP